MTWFPQKTVMVVVTAVFAIGLVPEAFANALPVITLPSTKDVFGGDSVRIRASARDEDSDSLAFLWEQVTGKQIKLRGLTTDTLSFTAPDVDDTEEYRFKLIVSDGAQNVDREITVSVEPKDETLPEVDAGNDREVLAGTTVELNGTVMDSDSLVLTFEWEQQSGPQVQFTKNLAKTSFIAPELSSDTNLSFQLTVDDGENTAKDMVNVLVRAPVPLTASSRLTPLSEDSSSPRENTTLLVNENLAFIEAPATAKAGEMIHLKASIDDPAATYFWRVANASLEVTDLYTRETTLVIPASYQVGQTVLVELSVFTPSNTVRKQHEIFIVAAATPISVSRSMEMPVKTTEAPVPVPSTSAALPEPQGVVAKPPLADRSVNQRVNLPMSTVAPYAASAIHTTVDLNPKLLFTAILVLAGLFCIGAGFLTGRKKVLVENGDNKQSSSHIYIYEQRK